MSDNWKAIAINDQHIRVQFDENTDIAGLEITLINELRQPILREKVTSHKMTIVSETEYPIFVQVGHALKYVEGSGGASYNEAVSQA